jgi:hypothetical protein
LLALRKESSASALVEKASPEVIYGLAVLRQEPGWRAEWRVLVCTKITAVSGGIRTTNDENKDVLEGNTQMLHNDLWCDLRALNKIPLVPVSTLLITGACLNFVGGDSVRSTSFCGGLVAGFACAFMNREAKLTQRRFWVLLMLVAVVMVAYNLLCFGFSHWQQSSWLCVAVFMLTSIVRTDHGMPLPADRVVVIREAEDERETSLEEEALNDV